MKRNLLIFVFMLVGITGFCNEDNHVIISIDLRSQITMHQRSHAVSKIKSVIPRLLKQNNINEGYASVQFFSVSKEAEDLERYISSLNTPFSEFKDTHTILSSLEESDFYQYHGDFYSVITIAKPYSLLKCKLSSPEKLVKRTFLALVTDYKYNGNDDFYGELKHVPGISKEKKEVIMNTIKDVQQNYFYKFIAEEDISYYGYSYCVSRGYISLFEVIPLQQYFSIESVLEFPHKITAARTKDGYQAKFNINRLDNPNYRFIRSEAFISIEGQDDVQEINEFGKDYVFNIPTAMIDTIGKENITISFKTWVQLLDDVYNHTVLTPDGTKLQGAEGLNRRIEVKLEKDAVILGCIPLWDGLYKISFWTDNQNIAAATWGWIFILIFIAIMIFIIWKSTQYKSKNNDVKI